MKLDYIMRDNNCDILLLINGRRTIAYVVGKSGNRSGYYYKKINEFIALDLIVLDEESGVLYLTPKGAKLQRELLAIREKA